MYRVSFNQTYDRLLEQIDRHKFTIDRISENISSGVRIHRLSDDPLALNDSMRLKRSLSSIEMFKKNIGFANDWMSETETSLKSMNDSLVRAKELAVQMADGTQNPETRRGAAQEIDQIIRHLVAVGNGKFDSRYLLTGQSSQPPYTIHETNGLVTSVDYNDAGIHFSIETNFGSETQVNITGEEISWDEGGTPTRIFDVLLDLRNALSSNDVDGIRNQIDRLDTALTSVNSMLSKVGSRMSSLEAKKTALDNIGVDKQILLSDTVDTDLASSISELEKTKTAFEACLKLFGNVSDLNIVHYI